MKRITVISLTTAIAIGSLPFFSRPAQASWGDFFLGVGAGVGTSAIINSNRRAQQQRYAPVSPDQEFFRGVQDGLNGARYDNPRNSPDYDRGFEEGVRRRNNSR
ncbi:MAG: hypothetical protein ACKO4S_09705 [Snowella sp.]|nr:MAG: hypothetical protein DCF12_13330 [Snowella sp.]